MRAIGIYITKSDIYNMRGRVRNAEMGGVTAIQWLADKLDFFFRIDTALDNPNRVIRLFFAHPASIKLLESHPDVLLIDCTYKTNRLNMPLLNICRATGNNMTPQFVVAFLSGEKEEDYTWAMEKFKKMLAQFNIS
jgi:MULE transposase domain